MIWGNDGYLVRLNRIYIMKVNDQIILKRIKGGDETALDLLYKNNYRALTSMIIKKGGSEDEARDVFQDALVVFWQNAIKPDFTLSSKISTYLYSVCTNLWLKEIERKSKFEYKTAEQSEENSFEKEESIKIVHECINELGDSCKEILTLYYFDGFSMEQIAKKMGLANSDTAKTKRYKCKKRLDSLVRSRYSSSDFLDQ